MTMDGPIDEGAMLERLDAELEMPAVESAHEALHLYFAVGHVLVQLNITPRDLGLGDHRYATDERVVQANYETEGDMDKARTLALELGDFAVEISDALANFLLAKGIAGTSFYVYLPCHNGTARYWPRSDTGKPKLLVLT